MPKLTVFNNVTLDGYFADRHSDMGWAHPAQRQDWREFTDSNATRGTGAFLFGRVTYELMAGFWPTPQAHERFPVVAECMNNRTKIVFSRTLTSVSWNNTTLAKGDLLSEVRRLKQESGNDLVILGSGSIVAQLAQARLIDEFQIALNPVALGAGRTMFDGLPEKLPLRLISSRVFSNGAVFLRYEPA